MFGRKKKSVKYVPSTDTKKAQIHYLAQVAKVAGEPLTSQEIAHRVGTTEQYVRQCIREINQDIQLFTEVSDGSGHLVLADPLPCGWLEEDYS